MEWIGLPTENRSWENIETIQRLMEDNNLEDKIKPEGGGDVTVELDLDRVVDHLRNDLNIQEDDNVVGDKTNVTSDEDHRRKSTRIKRRHQDNDFEYY